MSQSPIDLFSSLLKAYNAINDLVKEFPQHANFTAGIQHIQTGILWIKEGIMQVAQPAAEPAKESPGEPVKEGEVIPLTP